MSWVPEFQNPERLWTLVLLPILIIAYLIVLRLKGHVALRFTNTGVLGRVVGAQRRWTRHVFVAMSLASLIALGLAYANPLGVEKQPRERATVVMVIDTSLSMSAEDVAPNRLDAAKSAATTFMHELPDSYNVAVVSMSGSPSIAIPPTTDRGATERAIAALELSDGTAIGGSITSALKAIDQAPAGDDGEQAPAMIVLLSDGTNTEGGDPAEAAREAKDREIPIFTVAFGTDNGYVDVDGRRENVAPDPEALAALADATGGRAVDADGAASLGDAYREIGSVIGYEDVKKPITATYAAVALGFAVVAALGAVFMAARWPR
ncbi:Ca-activated chloride channel family protein [Tessaracoccus bendigoensis DSM 12906]|uniref:Ca-activated chloride channel family protein n=1 Tax=Tessaracoccus bendigoensis DSM 12906 TaxID=1123357 RepID=A0A1M6GUQ1_9ACTN|nr:VWA domain-containing protein [Tessaracoccus bendigoensis]SHJ13667.1 Ca-activated chloride channel family protein [Tessaracoccus bendigoensis DSM 12906]